MIKLLENASNDRYHKIDVMYTECGHKTQLCQEGIDRGITCKICNPKQKKKKKKKKQPLVPLTKEYWGRVYYAKIDNTPYYRIGISSDSVSEFVTHI